MPVDFSTGDKGRKVRSSLASKSRERVAATEPTHPSGETLARDVPRRPGQHRSEAAWWEKEYTLALQIAFAVEAFLYHGYPDWQVRDHAGDTEWRPAVSTAPWSGELEPSCAEGRLEGEGQA